MAEAAKTGLVVSAHSADFVWRAAGAIALYAKRGWTMKVVCLSFGERGESAKLWRMPGMTLERVKQDRRAEATPRGGIAGRRDRVPRCRRLSDARARFGAVPAGGHLSRTAAGVRAVPLARRPVQLRSPARLARRAGSAHHRPGAWPQSRRDRARRAARVPVRTAPDRAVQLEAAGAARHHRGMGAESARHSN